MPNWHEFIFSDGRRQFFEWHQATRAKVMDGVQATPLTWCTGCSMAMRGAQYGRAKPISSQRSGSVELWLVSPFFLIANLFLSRRWRSCSRFGLSFGGECQHNTAPLCWSRGTVWAMNDDAPLRSATEAVRDVATSVER